MAKIKLTVRQILNLGLWDQVCDYLGWEPHIIREGRIDYDDLVEFDDAFEKEVDSSEHDSVGTVQWLIDELSKIENKELLVVIDDHFSVESVDLIENEKLVKLSY